jgi:hypothetical protein
MFIINEILKISRFIDLLIFSIDNIVNEGIMFPLWVYGNCYVVCLNTASEISVNNW